MTLYTIGYTQKSARDFFTLLKGAGVRHLLDVRLNSARNDPASLESLGADRVDVGKSRDYSGRRCSSNQGRTCGAKTG